MVDINKLTVGEVREIAGLFGTVAPAKNCEPASFEVKSSYVDGDGRPVIVRARDAGVHFGYLVGYEGRRVDLTRSRRLWSWKASEDGSLSGVAVNGIDASKSKVAVVVEKITILDACEIIDASPKSVESIEAAKWA